VGQHLVAYAVAVGVVRLLEVVEVDHRQTGVRPAAGNPRGLGRHHLVQGSPVRQLGQGIGHGSEVVVGAC
jgi:hypothetical protein